jgi:RHS repeat-associated protein
MHSVSLKFLVGILSFSDYYPFGMQMVGRNDPGEGYRYGFQGQETDDEWTDSESHIAFTYRCYDARLGRFLSLDPLAPKYPHNSPYAFSENKVIFMIELEGLEAIDPSKKDNMEHLYILNDGDIYSVFYTDKAGNMIHGVTFDASGYGKAGASFWEGLGKAKAILDLGLAIDERVVYDGDHLKYGNFDRLGTVTGQFSGGVFMNANEGKWPTDDQVDQIASGGIGKTFRHMVWQGVLAMIYGEETAKAFGDAQEVGTASGSRDGNTANTGDISFGDLINNQTGRDLANEYKAGGGNIKTKRGLVKYLNVVQAKLIEEHPELGGMDKFTTKTPGVDLLFNQIRKASDEKRILTDPFNYGDN